MKRMYKGIVESDNIIRLKEVVDLPKGTEALISLYPFMEGEEKEIQKRELKFLEDGFDMGRVIYAKREELYGR